jgi:hypothetical protein
MRDPTEIYIVFERTGGAKKKEGCGMQTKVQRCKI